MSFHLESVYARGVVERSSLNDAGTGRGSADKRLLASCRIDKHVLRIDGHGGRYKGATSPFAMNVGDEYRNRLRWERKRNHDGGSGDERS